MKQAWLHHFRLSSKKSKKYFKINKRFGKSFKLQEIMENVTLLFLVLSAVTIAAASIEENSDCNTDDDCKSDECCLRTGYWKTYKRACTKKLLEGEDCIREEDTIAKYTGFYYGLCPCVDNLECKPTKYLHLHTIKKFGINTRCVAKDTPDPPDDDASTTIESETTQESTSETTTETSE